MSITTTQYTYAVGLADALQWPPWGRRQTPLHPAHGAAGEQAATENIANAPLGRPVNQRARSLRATSIADEDQRLQLQAESTSAPLSPEELDSSPIAYTALGQAVHESLPQGVLLDIVA